MSMKRTMKPKPSPSTVRARDPELEQETGKYPKPLPSRTYIMQTLEQHGVPMPFEQLAATLELLPDEQESFERRLRAMERDGQVMQNRRGAWLIPDKADLIRGRVAGHPDGYGFCIPDAGGEDLFLPPREMRSVLHGDRVLVRRAGVDRRGRREARIVEIIERANTRIVGRVVREAGVALLVPEDKRISQDVLIETEGRGKKKKALPEAGTIVVGELLSQPSTNVPPVVRIVEILGRHLDPGMEIEIALRKHDLPFEFSRAALAQASRVPERIKKADLAGREDLRTLPLVTIDGETARDFDDAVFAQAVAGRCWRLIVAIADVGHYVAPDSPLDREAFERGNSVYFPRRVIPMLPEKLSNGLCSLNPDVDRLCLACDMVVGAAGAIRSYRFYPAVMRSHARLTYTEVAAALYEGDADAQARLGSLRPHLESLNRVFGALARARSRRGAIDFDTVETQIDFDENGKIRQILPYERNDAHRLIEECMLAANVCASDFLEQSAHPVLYRIHAGPSADRLARLREFLAGFGLQLAGGDGPQAKHYAKLLEQIAQRPDRQLLQTVMLRSLSQAVYSPDNVGHFGLAYERYTHFTSPIRRYPDLLVHRAIRAALAGRRYAPGDWDEIGRHCSMTERRADEATREVMSFLKCHFMRDRIGERFSGSVSSVTPFGLFVALDDTFVEGLVHISDLGNDYFHYHAARHELLGERSGRRFRLADRLHVELLRVDTDTRKIDFRLVDEAGARKGKRRG
ncbi:MAG: Ribonuclease R [Rhodocyclaceae bacterium]|nr:Ribonuclease R [Rhodocyclaceae bacterium]